MKKVHPVAPLVAIALGATVAALPLTFGKSDSWLGIGLSIADAKDHKDDDEDRGNRGNGGGGDEDRGNRGNGGGEQAAAEDNRGQGNARNNRDDDDVVVVDNRGRGNAEDRGQATNRGRGNANDTVVVDNRGPGNAVDRGNAPAERTEARATVLAEARLRYEEAMERKGGPGETEVADIGKRERTLTDDETRAVLARGWQARQDDDGEFRNHGERVRTFVAIAKALGHEASVGAMQANFGTATEGFTKPGDGPTDWQTVDLDVNKDGKVNELDLIAALNPPPPVTTPPAVPPTVPPTTPPTEPVPPPVVEPVPPTTTTPPTEPTTPIAEPVPPTTTTPTTEPAAPVAGVTEPTPTPPAPAPAA